MQRQWKRSLAAIALLLALGTVPAWAATIEVTPATPPAIKADGRCSLIEAVVNAATLRRSTISGNRLVSEYESVSGAGVKSLGADATLTILASTITGNSLSLSSTSYYAEIGGGLAVSAGSLALQRSIVSGNTARAVREVSVGDLVTVTAEDHNVFGYSGDAGVSGFLPDSTDIVPDKAIGGILLPLADNGGPTFTHALAMNSPALDAVPVDAGCPRVDQRDSPRPRGPACDIGAFEGAAVLCNGKVTTQVGTDGPDELMGTAGPDVIAGLNGDDAIGGLDGNDTLCGGGGNDAVFGGLGSDVLSGQGGNDRLSGNRGADKLDGGPGTDQCDGGTESDTATTCEAVSNVP